MKTARRTLGPFYLYPAIAGALAMVCDNGLGAAMAAPPPVPPPTRSAGPARGGKLPGVTNPGAAPAGSVPAANGSNTVSPNSNLQGNGPNINPNAPNNSPNGPNQNPYAPFNGPVGAAAYRDFGGPPLGNTVPLGNLGFGGLNTGLGGVGGLPWFFAFPFGYGFNGYGYGPYGFGFSNGYYPGTYGNIGYWGVGSGGYGLDNLAGAGTFVGEAPPVNGPPNRPATRAVETASQAGSAEEQRQVIENAKAANSLYYQFRETNRAYRLMEIARDRATPQALAKAALDSVPRWLGPDELDRSSGRIAWPAALKTPDFSTLRSHVEEAFRQRNSSGSSEAETAQTIRDNVRLMMDLLRVHIEDYPADEYLTARRFLDSVEYAVHKSVPR